MGMVAFLAAWVAVMGTSWWILLGRSMWRDWLADDLPQIRRRIWGKP